MKEKIWMIFFLFFIGVASATLTYGFYIYTKPTVAHNQEMKLITSILDVFSIPYTHENAKKVFKENIQIIKSGKLTYYKSTSGGFAFAIKGSGLWAPIIGLLALEKDKTTIHGLKILENLETPGLGGRISEKEFLLSFSGKKMKPNLVMVSRKKAQTENEIDAITGATLTSNALADIINLNYQAYKDILK